MFLLSTHQENNKLNRKKFVHKITLIIKFFIEEIREMKCENPQSISAKWSAMDRRTDNNSGSGANHPGASSRIRAPVILATNNLRFTEDFDVELFQHGPILHHVQVSDVLHDGKEFVDRPALFSPYTIQSRWNKLVESKGIPSNEEIKAFVEENFGDSGWELVPVNSNDLDTDPSYIDTLQNEELIRLAKEIQELWFDLGKQVRPQVKSLGKRTSLLYVPNMFVIPGGRFKEGFSSIYQYFIKKNIFYGRFTAVQFFKNSF